MYVANVFYSLGAWRKELEGAGRTTRKRQGTRVRSKGNIKEIRRGGGQGGVIW